MTFEELYVSNVKLNSERIQVLMQGHELSSDFLGRVVDILKECQTQSANLTFRDDSYASIQRISEFWRRELMRLLGTRRFKPTTKEEQL